MTVFKLCLMCSTIYEGNLQKYGKNSLVAYGVCKQPKCLEDFLMMSTQCSRNDARMVLNELKSKKVTT